MVNPHQLLGRMRNRRFLPMQSISTKGGVMIFRLLLVGTIAIAVLVFGFVAGMCITAKKADEAMTDAIKTIRDKGAL